jgi:hypothetical protein
VEVIYRRFQIEISVFHDLVADDETVHIIDEQENEWLLRSIVAEALLQLYTGNFPVARLNYTGDFSKIQAQKLFFFHMSAQSLNYR